MNSTNPNTNNDVARLRWEIKISEEDGIPYLWDNRKYDNYDLGSLCRILNEYEEKNNEVARLREDNQKIREICDRAIEILELSGTWMLSRWRRDVDKLCAEYEALKKNQK